MTNIYSAIQVSDHVYWVGAIDWSIRDFHGYTTPHGSTYNAYLILADKITLIDTVKKPFLEEILARIASVIDPAKID
jgi:flavorubredoxin